MTRTCIQHGEFTNQTCPSCDSDRAKRRAERDAWKDHHLEVVCDCGNREAVSRDDNWSRSGPECTLECGRRMRPRTVIEADTLRLVVHDLCDELHEARGDIGCSSIELLIVRARGLVGPRPYGTKT